MATAAVALGTTAAAAPLPRVASLNACTDQLLVGLAEPDQIVGLSPYAGQTLAPTEIARYPRLSGGAEDVLASRPDLVLAGALSWRTTRDLLERQGLAVAEFDVATTIPAAEAQIRRAGALLQQPQRAATLVGLIEAAAARARAATGGRSWRVLPLERRGWVSGRDAPTNSLIEAAGLTNAAREFGFASGGYASLEAIVALRPDLLLVEGGMGRADDQGEAYLEHPALARLYPAEKRIVVPGRLTVCAGPLFAQALDRLTAELARVKP